jgi:hypothetical protein
MKEVLKKIRNKRLKGNVSLLVIFILLASSVISLLSINQIQRLLTYWNTTFNYFRAFYLAKAGTELGLTEVYYREAWFEDSISSWNAIVTENLVGAYSGFNPYFTMSISWNFQYLTDDIRYTNECSDDNKITLGTWEWIMLSLFNDTTSWINSILTTTNENNIKGVGDESIKQLEIKWKETQWGFQYFTFWLFDYDKDWNMNNIFVETWNDLGILKHLDDKDSNGKNLNWETRKYLTIKNPWTWNEVVSFCIHNKDGKSIPYSNSLITVRGNYGDMEVWLQSVVKKEVPFWAMDVLWWPN